MNDGYDALQAQLQEKERQIDNQEGTVVALQAKVGELQKQIRALPTASEMVYVQQRLMGREELLAAKDAEISRLLRTNAERDRELAEVRENLKQYSGWSPDQFLGLLAEYRAAGKVWIEKESSLLKRIQELEQELGALKAQHRAHIGSIVIW